MKKKPQNEEKTSVAAYRKALAAQPKFCDLCGTTLNEADIPRRRRSVTALQRCRLCRNAISGPMIMAYIHWKEMGDKYNRCCGRFSHDREFLFFHGKYFDDSYPLTKKGQPRRRGAHVEVEHGVAFYRDYAQPYYLRDFDHYCDSQDYGDPVLYSSPKFWEEVEVQFGSAAKAAWDSDLQTCRACGYHYDPSIEECPCKGRK